jgi:hypothetical protein
MASGEAHKLNTVNVLDCPVALVSADMRLWHLAVEAFAYLFGRHHVAVHGLAEHNSGEAI